MKACKDCNYLSDNPRCPYAAPGCPGPTQKSWQGYVIVHDPANSRIAHRMNVTKPGRYALKVR